MKRIGYLYEKITSVNNCYWAIVEAAQSKKDRAHVQRILDDIDYYAADLSMRLTVHNFTSPYMTRTIQDGLSGKERVLDIPAFYPDLCAQHAIERVLRNIILSSSYYWSCANIPDRGIDRAARGVERATKHDTKHAKYCVKMDIHKFYPSIPPDKLKARLREKIKDTRALAIIDAEIDSHSKGLPIGNFTSPWFAEFYLQPLDMFIKQTLKIKYYIRYADDMVLIGNNKRKLHKAMRAIIFFVRNRLGLEIKSNYQLFLIQRDGSKRGRKIDFVGRCFGIGFTTIRKRRALALMRQSRHIQKLQREDLPISYKMAAGFMSRSACYKHTDSYLMKQKYYETVNIKQLKEVIRNESKRQRIAKYNRDNGIAA